MVAATSAIPGGDVEGGVVDGGGDVAGAAADGVIGEG
jgi:hypothetical protein